MVCAAGKVSSEITMRRDMSDGYFRRMRNQDPSTFDILQERACELRFDTLRVFHFIACIRWQKTAYVTESSWPNQDMLVFNTCTVKDAANSIERM